MLFSFSKLQDSSLTLSHCPYPIPEVHRSIYLILPAKQGKQNQWKVNHSEGFQHSRNRLCYRASIISKKCTRCGRTMSPMHGRKDCPTGGERLKMFCERTLRSYVPLKENSPKTGRRRGCHIIYCVITFTTVDSRKRMKSRETTSVVNSLELQDHAMQTSKSTAKRLILSGHRSRYHSRPKEILH